MKNLKKSDIDSLLIEVETALTAVLKEEQEKLSKAHPGEETSSETDSDTSATDPKTPDASASAPTDSSAAPASAPPVDASSPAPDASAPPAPDVTAAPADASAPADPAADVSNDPQALQEEYSKLGATDPEALKNHYLACKAALFALMGAGADASAPAPATPAATPGAAIPPAASPSPDAPPAMKSELGATGTGGMPTSTEEANGGKGMMKSEKEQIKGLTDQLAKQEDALASLLSVIEAVVEAPVRKAVTSVAHLAKTEESEKKDLSNLSNAEVKARLRKAAEKPLSKSDRGLINGFDLGHIGVDKVAHLIGDVK